MKKYQKGGSSTGGKEEGEGRRWGWDPVRKVTEGRNQLSKKTLPGLGSLRRAPLWGGSMEKEGLEGKGKRKRRSVGALDRHAGVRSTYDLSHEG